MKSIFTVVCFILSIPIFAQIYPYSELNQKWIIQNGIRHFTQTEYGANKKGKIDKNGTSWTWNYDSNGIEYNSNTIKFELTDSTLIEYRLSFRIDQTVDTLVSTTCFDETGKKISFQSGEIFNQYFYDSEGKLIKMFLVSTRFKSSYFNVVELKYRDTTLIQIIKKNIVDRSSYLKDNSTGFSFINLSEFHYDIHGIISEEFLYKGKDFQDLKKYRRAKYYSYENGLLWKVYCSDVNEMKEIVDFVIEYHFE